MENTKGVVSGFKLATKEGMNNKNLATVICNY